VPARLPGTPARSPWLAATRGEAREGQEGEGEGGREGGARAEVEGAGWVSVTCSCLVVKGRGVEGRGRARAPHHAGSRSAIDHRPELHTLQRPSVTHRGARRARIARRSGTGGQ
jgi:hypothetical protein